MNKQQTKVKRNLVLSKSQTKVVSALTQRDMSLKELELKTKLNKNGIRGRVSEMKVRGINITRVGNKYHLNKNTFLYKLFGTCIHGKVYPLWMFFNKPNGRVTK